MEYSGNISIFSIRGTLYGNISRNFIETFCEYSGNIPWECSTNIPRIYICPMGLFKQSDKVKRKMLFFITLAYQSINNNKKLGLDIIRL